MKGYILYALHLGAPYALIHADGITIKNGHPSQTDNICDGVELL